MGRVRNASKWRAGSLALLAVGLLAGLAVVAPARTGGHRVAAASATCISSGSPSDLTTLFDREPDGLLAADYQRSLRLPDGRVLWTFQDATIRIQPTPPEGLPTQRLVHNAALIQTGTCFELLHDGTDADPRSWLFPNETTPLARWFWPLDATISDQGLIWVFMAEMVENGPGYLTATEPVGTRVVALDPNTLQPVGSGIPANSGPSLYGFSITEDDDWTYLYAQCHRQFGYDLTIFGTLGHDMSCVDDVTVGRVPKGRILESPTYWDGTAWQADPARAVAVMPRGKRRINPTQVMWTGEEFLAVTKEGDWLGTNIYFDRAPAAQGPWSNYGQITAVPKCAPNICNTYFASWISPDRQRGDLIVGLSHNRWDGAVSSINRPTFFAVPPPGRFAFVKRCSVGQC